MSRFKKTIILLGDWAILYGALAAALWARYLNTGHFQESLLNHLPQFSFIFPVWLIVFYLNDLYHQKTFKNNLVQLKSLAAAVAVSIGVSIVLFYLFASFFKLTPKTNLIIFGAIFTALDYGWRLAVLKMFVSEERRSRILIVGEPPSAEEIIAYLKTNPQLGFSVTAWRKKESDIGVAENLKKLIADEKINAIVADAKILGEKFFLNAVRRLFPYEISVVKSTDFHETIFQKIPLAEIDDRWFVENLAVSRRLYETAKTVLETVLAAVLAVALAPLAFLIAVLVKTTSKGPVIYKQRRVGKGGRAFTLYKFRTMRIDSPGPLWTAENDRRLTFAGKILRFTHLDEIPQLYNILKGDISFIGPRPERVELAEKYGSLPYYEMRHLIKPGLTGWAQVNYRPSTSLEEAHEKLEYDLYYVKNRSLFLDLTILLKTIKYLFIPRT